jgi:hypothetical protein
LSGGLLDKKLEKFHVIRFRPIWGWKATLAGLCADLGGQGKFFHGLLTVRAETPHSTRVPRAVFLKT